MVWVLPVAVVRVRRKGPPVEVRAEPREVRSNVYLPLPAGVRRTSSRRPCMSVSQAVATPLSTL